MEFQQASLCGQQRLYNQSSLGELGAKQWAVWHANHAQLLQQGLACALHSGQQALQHFRHAEYPQGKLVEPAYIDIGIVPHGEVLQEELPFASGFAHSPPKRQSRHVDMCRATSERGRAQAFANVAMRAPPGLEHMAGRAFCLNTRESSPSSAASENGTVLDMKAASCTSETSTVVPFDEEDGEFENSTPKTTVILRNLPCAWSRSDLLSWLDSEGWRTQYNFVYLPLDHLLKCSFGYSFINLVSTEAAARFWEQFQGYKWPAAEGHAEQPAAELEWSSKLQGFAQNIQRYRDSPMMHETVPDECKPVVFADGVRVTFPTPTKSLRKPRKWTSKSTSRSIASLHAAYHPLVAAVEEGCAA